MRSVPRRLPAGTGSGVGDALTSAGEALNRELNAASPALVGNEDLLRGVLAGCGDCIKILDLNGRLQFMSEGGKRVMEVDGLQRAKGLSLA